MNFQRVFFWHSFIEISTFLSSALKHYIRFWIQAIRLGRVFAQAMNNLVDTYGSWFD